jgi:CRP/FNR family transcriptional regulator, cyclic AMP receptor protein
MVLDVLKRHAFVAGMADCHLGKLALLAQPVSFEENARILRAGERSEYFYLLLSGSVCVEVSTRVYALCIHALHAGDAFGWSSLLDRHDTLFQVRARERAMALCLDGEALSRACRDEPALGAELLHRTLKLVAGRVQATELRLGELWGLCMPGRRAAGRLKLNAYCTGLEAGRNERANVGDEAEVGAGGIRPLAAARSPIPRRQTPEFAGAGLGRPRRRAGHSFARPHRRISPPAGGDPLFVN